MNALDAQGLTRLGPLEEREDVLLVFHARDKEEIERRLAEILDAIWTSLTARISRWDLRIGAVGVASEQFAA